MPYAPEIPIKSAGALGGWTCTPSLLRKTFCLGLWNFPCLSEHHLFLFSCQLLLFYQLPSCIASKLFKACGVERRRRIQHRAMKMYWPSGFPSQSTPGGEGCEGTCADEFELICIFSIGWNVSKLNINLLWHILISVARPSQLCVIKIDCFALNKINYRNLINVSVFVFCLWIVKQSALELRIEWLYFKLI